ncbi:hypothetical protein [Pseudomonas phytophila]|uniref:hypothetical protein n=1 Tax=Pseudomonas phytophila TaxID=2867264 RepID=UPI002954A8B0|nr:hypothetical protein [Pseudomonas phytophila]
MYTDAKRIRKHRATLSLDDYELDLINAQVNYTDMEKAQLLRALTDKQNPVTGVRRN